MAIASSLFKKGHAAAEPPRLLRWLDYFPLAPLAIAALVLALAPPFAEPHLWRDLKQLAAGSLTEAVDVLDFAFHATLLVLLMLKLVRMWQLHPLKLV